MEFSLDCSLVTEPIFRDLFSIDKSPFEMEFSLGCCLVTELMFHDVFSINKSLLQTNNFLSWYKVYHDLIYEPFGF